METAEGNKLIAEFMGGKFKNVDYFGDGRITEEIIFIDHPSQLINGTGRTFSNMDDLRYHSSWDWLKPVVDKIFEYSLAYPEQSQWVCSAKIVVDIAPCWENVVKFITWYNNTKK